MLEKQNPVSKARPPDGTWHPRNLAHTLMERYAIPTGCPSDGACMFHCELSHPFRGMGDVSGERAGCLVAGEISISCHVLMVCVPCTTLQMLVDVSVFVTSELTVSSTSSYVRT